MCNCKEKRGPDVNSLLRVEAHSNGVVVSGETHNSHGYSNRVAVFTDPKALGEWFQAWFQNNIPAEEP